MWLRVSKLYIKPGIPLFGQIDPVSAKDLIRFLLTNGCESYQRISTDWGQLSVGRFKTEEDEKHTTEIVKKYPSYITRQNYLRKYNILYELVYRGTEEDYDSNISGIILPPPDFKSINKTNMDAILYKQNEKN